MDRNYKHPKHEMISLLIERGQSDRGISLALGADRRSVTRIRRMLGVPAISTTTSMDAKLAAHTTEPDGDGHTHWTGSRTSGGVPRVRQGGHELAVPRVMFERRVRRSAVGVVRADCGSKGCITGAHLADDIERRTIRLMLRSLQGYPAPWEACTACGGDWHTCGKIEQNLELYCGNCSTNRARRNRKAKVA